MPCWDHARGSKRCFGPLLRGPGGLLSIDIDRFQVLAAVGLLGAVQHSLTADLPAVKGKFQLPARTSLGKDVVLRCNPVPSIIINFDK